MKKLTPALTLALTLTLAMAICTPAHAGILATINGWILDNGLTLILTTVFTLVAGFWGGSAWGKLLLKAKLPIMELKDVAVRIHEARRPGSPGGRKVTTEEKDAILKEVEELVQSIVATFGKGK